MNLYELLDQAPDPDATALVDRSKDPAERVSYRELRERALRVAGGLVARGLQPGDRVGVLADNCGEYYDAVFGAVAAGCAVVPLNTRLPRDQQAFIAADAAVQLVIADEANLPRAPEGVALVQFATPGWTALAGAAPLAGPVAVADDDVAVHIYTSGSTGRPKGVLLTHRNICWTCLEYGVAIPGEVMLVSAPLYHKNASMASKLCFVNGGTVVLLPRFTAAGYIDAIETERVTMCSAACRRCIALVTADIAASGRTPDFTSVRTVLDRLRPADRGAVGRRQAAVPRRPRWSPTATARPRRCSSSAAPTLRADHAPRSPLGYRHPKVELRLVDPASRRRTRTGASCGSAPPA